MCLENKSFKYPPRNFYRNLEILSLSHKLQLEIRVVPVYYFPPKEEQSGKNARPVGLFRISNMLKVHFDAPVR